ncbi:MAG TPA: pseudouridine synthase [Candidatus Baltobacteraceae bacterium]|jgi:pseudouridine synthase|nr:pseudouridine synthase [Candidatus Baltobacteraceae bacterium]
MRLNKFLAQAGVASRRGADELITGGRVSLNGRIVRELGTIVARGDAVLADGVPVQPPQSFSYLVLHKPAGVVTTMRDPAGRRTVADLLPKGPRVVPVGRLDYATDGVLLLTNDGELAHSLLHPRFGVEKTYRATIAGEVRPQDLRRLRDGIVIDGRRTSTAAVRTVAFDGGRSIVELTIHEGRNRQVRRMFETLGYRVAALTRTRFGPLTLGRLAPGKVRPLTAKERSALEHHRRPRDGPPRSKRDT